jgi:alkanesulfonate monooxygenase SsuD/methylene tetrahydromethanopterin reductase-like flavin-dependent oxidoreductase (luciferase family)
MKDIKVHTTALGPSLDTLRDQVRRYDEIGLDGVFVDDHLFFSRGRSRREASRGSEPFIRLAVAGSLSKRLLLGTGVINLGFAHPALPLRQFLELASLFGGDRVIAGIGAGWNGEEFDALGMTFDPFARRMDRLEEAAGLFRTVFDTGTADVSGEQIVTRELPMGPPLKPPPRLMLGGGSDRLLDIAGRYADILDLNGSSRRLKLGRDQPIFKDAIRRLTTTVADLETAAGRVRASATAAGRDPDGIEFSVIASTIRFCSDSEVAEQEAEVCRNAGVDPMPLDDCPYVFIGPEARMREQFAERAHRIRVRHILVTPIGYDDMARFRHEVVAAAVQ